MYTFVFVCVFSCAYVFICGVEGRGGACVCPCVYAHVCVSTTVSTNESVCIQLYLSFVSVYPCEYVRIPFATARARIPARGEGGGAREEEEECVCAACWAARRVVATSINQD